MLDIEFEVRPVPCPQFPDPDCNNFPTGDPRAFVEAIIAYYREQVAAELGEVVSHEALEQRITDTVATLLEYV